MTFIDKKEETFDLVLTEKGREKLSKGKFKPHSYSFYDNDVVYDRSYRGTGELQNEIAPRIKKMPITGEQTTWDDTVRDKSGIKDSLKYPKYFELGGYEFTSQNKPAWRVYLKEGLITGSVKHIPFELEKANKIADPQSGELLDSYLHDKIPQLNVFCEYKIYRVVDSQGVERIYVDRSSDDMHFEIYEENSFDDKENFIVDVMQYSDSYTELKKLIFVEEEDPITQDNVEHFFNIATDGQKMLDINYTEFMEKKLVFEDEC
jgi:hypothetical protein